MIGHRHLLAYLAAGGFIQPDDSGIAWVQADRSGEYYTNELVSSLIRKGFRWSRKRCLLAESADHPGKWRLVEAPPRKRRKKSEEAQ